MTQEQIGQISGEVKARPKLEGGRRFKMISEFSEAGDQPTAIRELAAGIQGQERDQVLLGRNGHRQNLYYGPFDRGNPTPRDYSGTQ